MLNFATYANTVFKLQFKHLWQLIGNSPLLVIDFLYKGKKRVIYAKAEHYNITGSIKDRMALYILEKAYAEGRIKKGDTIVEATSGNTGISFSAIGRALGHPVQDHHARLDESRTRGYHPQPWGSDHPGIQRRRRFPGKYQDLGRDRCK